MPEKVYIEEKGKYQLDCNTAIWSTDEMHSEYHKFGLSHLCDADFVIETEECLYLVEYKNGILAEAIEHNSGFNPNEPKYIDKIIRKFYDSLHFLTINGKHKPLKYVYIVEAPSAGVTDRKLLRNKIAQKLPFEWQKGKAIKLIDDFQVVSIGEWNAHDDYRAFPLTAVCHEVAT